MSAEKRLSQAARSEAFVIRPAVVAVAGNREWPEPADFQVRLRVVRGEFGPRTAAVLLAWYAISFCLPAFGFRRPWYENAWYGVQCFFFFASNGSIIWLANPVFWLGCIFLAVRRGKTAACLGGAALVLGSFFLMHGGGDQLLVGYYWWLSSFALLTVAGIMCATEGAPRVHCARDEPGK